MGNRGEGLSVPLTLEVVGEWKGKIFHFHLHQVKEYQKVDFLRIPSPYGEEGSFVDHRFLLQGSDYFSALFSLLKKTKYQGLFDFKLRILKRVNY